MQIFYNFYFRLTFPPEVYSQRAASRGVSEFSEFSEFSEYSEYSEFSEFSGYRRMAAAERRKI